MEVLLGGAVIGLGYLFTKDGVNRNNPSFMQKVSKNNVPNGKNILESNRSYNIWQDEQKKAQELFAKTTNPAKTNVIIPGPPFKKIKVDYADKQLPIEFNAQESYDKTYLNLDTTSSQMTNNLSINNANPPAAGNWVPIDSGAPITPNDLFTENTGQNIEPMSNRNGSNGMESNTFASVSSIEQVNGGRFEHNNMTPFFGGHVKQNVDQYANRSLLENFTGNIDNYRKKKEVGTFFKPQRNLTNVYGTQSFDSSLYDRYQTSRIRNNEAPIEQVRVGPGLNQGFTWKPSGGFQQSNTRDYVLPKTTNESRVLNNPKVSYKGRVISGQHISLPGKIGTVQKNLPDRFYVQQPDRYFTTTGQTIAQAEYPEYIVKHTNRKDTEQKKRIGSAAPVNGTVENIRSKVKRSSKLTLDTSEPRNATISGQWSINNPEAQQQNQNKIHNPPNDYGRSSLTNKQNARMKTQLKSVVLNKKSIIEGGEYRNGQAPRPTRKTNVVGNTRWASNVQGPHNRHKVYDPNDVPRTTIKETNIHDSNGGNMGIQAPSRQPVYDPNDVPRTTIKETNIHDNNGGYMSIQGPSRQPVYDPNDVPRTTIKETNIHDNNGGYMGIQAPSRQPVYDPNDVPRTTIKETNIHDNNGGYMSIQGPSRQRVYDPNDVPRVTIKETNIHNERTGNVGNRYQLKSVAYDPNNVPRTTMKQTSMMKNTTGNIQGQYKNDGYLHMNVEASETNRQKYSTDYTGNPEGQNGGGYEVANAVPRLTKKQFLSDTDYTGNAGSFQQKPMSYTDIYNATISTNRQAVEGRVPCPEGNKGMVSPSRINMTTSKNGTHFNQQLNQRGVQPSRIYNSIPQNVMCSETKSKESVSNEVLADRLDPRMVSQFKRNPYTQSLSSYAFP